MKHPACCLIGCCCTLASSAAGEESSLKHLALDESGNIYLSLGGDLRERFEFYDQPSFGLRGIEQDGYLLHRLLLSADLHTGELFRLFVQFGNHLEADKEVRSPTDVDEFDLQQLYFDLNFPLASPEEKLVLRGGRQEMTFGSGRLISVREGANIRRSFDGARLTFKTGQATFDAFAVRTVELKTGALNDGSNDEESLWGLYSVVPLEWLPDGHADFYYLGLDRADAEFQQGTGHEKRHSFGTRIWGKPGQWDYNYEAVIQRGTFANADIQAWTIATDTGYTFRSFPWKPRVGMKADLATGDSDPNDNRLATFNALFPKQPYFSEASLIAPANIMDLHPTLSFQLAEKISLTADWDFFWKHRRADAIYSPPGRPLVAAGQSDSRYIGSQANIGIEWQPDPSISCALYYSHFLTGPAVTDAGGRDVDFIGSWVAVHF